MIIGITGNICSGKSEVAEAFRKAGILTVDTDLLAWNVMRGCVVADLPKDIKSHPALDEMDERLIIEKVVSDAIVANSELLDAIEAYIHPEVLDYLQGYAANNEIMAVESAILFESQLDTHLSFDEIIMVTASRDERLRRYHNKHNPYEYPPPNSAIANQKHEERIVRFGALDRRQCRIDEETKISSSTRHIRNEDGMQFLNTQINSIIYHIVEEYTRRRT
jgi:dephospho-CoA kinase